jgi:hypothetical protein
VTVPTETVIMDDARLQLLLDGAETSDLASVRFKASEAAKKS